MTPKHLKERQDCLFLLILISLALGITGSVFGIGASLDLANQDPLAQPKPVEAEDRLSVGSLLEAPRGGTVKIVTMSGLTLEGQLVAVKEQTDTVVILTADGAAWNVKALAIEAATLKARK